MLGLRCIVGNLHGGGRLLRSLPHVQKSCVSSSSLTSQRVSLHRGLPPPAARRFLSQDRGSSARSARFKLQTRVAVTLAFGGGLMAVWWYVYSEKEQKLRQQRLQQLQQVALGQGNFSLLDHTGQRRTKRDFLGSWPLFITVDPERDDVPALARYVKDFHPRLVGLTGTPEEVKEAGRDYRVYASPGPKDEDGDYIVDHTILIYLVSPDGLFLDYYNRMKNQDQIAESVRNHIRNHVPLADT
uniref:Synthesis of cytochrome C oxidase 2 n=1 Tax=Labrus bergylta TaxID=56723 RepID=A0A3Q3EMX8_9LABR